MAVTIDVTVLNQVGQAVDSATVKALEVHGTGSASGSSNGSGAASLSLTNSADLPGAARVRVTKAGYYKCGAVVRLRADQN